MLYASDAPIGGRPEPVRRPAFALKRCSWCARVTSHAQVGEGFWLLRATFRCGGCARRTLPCRRAGCDAHARGRADWDEDLCLVHRGVLPRWPRDARDEADARERLAPVARCSWCLGLTRHALEVATLKGAEVFSCGRCARCTTRCAECERPPERGSYIRGSSSPFERDNTSDHRSRVVGFAKLGDAACALCLGLVYDWDAPAETNAELTTRRGWCSWCGELGAHFVRDAAREWCECETCGGGTAPCPRCPGVMLARGSAVVAAADARAGACARCDVARRVSLGRAGGGNRGKSRDDDDHSDADAAWDAFRARRLAADRAASVDGASAQLRRSSRHRAAASRTGLLRPFLALATLPARERQRLGSRLGVSLARTRGYLDPHAEAWTLLSAKKKGIAARANRGAARELARAILEPRREDDAYRDDDDDIEGGFDEGGGAFARRSLGGFITGAVASASPSVTNTKNWLEVLAAALSAGAESGACPASDPRTLAALPAFRHRGAVQATLRTKRAVAVGLYEEAFARLVAEAQVARFSPAQRVTLDRVAAHPSAATLRARLRRAGAADDATGARLAAAAAYAASAWCAEHDAPLGVDAVRKCAEDVFGCLLDGVGPKNKETEEEGDEDPEEGERRDAREGTGGARDDDSSAGSSSGFGRSSSRSSSRSLGTGVAPSLLASLSNAGRFGPAFSPAGAALAALGAAPRLVATASPRDFLRVGLGAAPRAPAEYPPGAAGLFEPLAVIVTHVTLLAARGVALDDYRLRGEGTDGGGSSRTRRRNGSSRGSSRAGSRLYSSSDGRTIGGASGASLSDDLDASAQSAKADDLDARGGTHRGGDESNARGGDETNARGEDDSRRRVREWDAGRPDPENAAAEGGSHEAAREAAREAAVSDPSLTPADPAPDESDDGWPSAEEDE